MKFHLFRSIFFSLSRNRIWRIRCFLLHSEVSKPSRVLFLSIPASSESLLQTLHNTWGLLINFSTPNFWISHPFFSGHGQLIETPKNTSRNLDFFAHCDVVFANFYKSSLANLLAPIARVSFLCLDKNRKHQWRRRLLLLRVWCHIAFFHPVVGDLKGLHLSPL